MTWWLTIHTADGVHCWPVGDPSPDERADLVIRARQAVGLAPDDVATTPVMFAQGEPHPQLLSRAKVHKQVDLQNAARTDVDTYAAAHVAAAQQRQVDAVHAAVKDLPEAARTVLRSQLGWAPKPNDGRA